MVGENDRSLVKHNAAKAELMREGIHFEGEPFSLKATDAPSITFLVAPKTGHDMHPDSRKTLNAFLYERIKMGRQTPDHIRFVTYTTRYNRDYWLTVDGLGKHYERADIDAVRLDHRTRYQITTQNTTRLVLDQMNQATSISIDGQALQVKPAAEMAFEKSNGTWKPAFADRGLRKKHGSQGPIDDAFLEPVLVVRPTGKPWNAAVNDQALRMLQRFERQYSIAYRGHIRMKDDKDVTPDDLAHYHLILFGDPGSNRWIGRLNRKLAAAALDEGEVQFGDQEFPLRRFLAGHDLPEPVEFKPLCGDQQWIDRRLGGLGWGFPHASLWRYRGCSRTRRIRRSACCVCRAV